MDTSRPQTGIQYATDDQKYYIREKIGKKDEWIITEYNNAVENELTLFLGSLKACEKFLFDRGYKIEQIIKQKSD